MPDPAGWMAEVIESSAYVDLSDEGIAHLQDLATDVVARLETRLAGPGRLLDVGCGPGILLSVARDRGWQVQGLELAAGSVERCQRVGHDVKSQTLDDFKCEEGSFDAVVLHHVLEHIADPRAAIEKCCRVLRRGGTLFIAVPNADSWRARLQGDRNEYVYQRDHLLFFSSATLKKLVGQYASADLAVETCRLGGRVGRIVASSIVLAPVQGAMEWLHMGVEIRCWATKG
jgi:SAM-dependent methyltransferase